MLYTPSRKHTTSWPRPRRTHHTTHHTTPHQKHIQQNTPTNTRHTTPHHTTPTTTRNRTSNTYHTPHRTHYATQHHTHISAATMSEQPCDTTPHPPSTRRKQCITCVLWNSSDSACTDRWHTMRIENKTVYTNATQRSHHDRRTSSTNQNDRRWLIDQSKQRSALTPSRSSLGVTPLGQEHR